MSSLEVEGLVVRYGGRVAVKNVTFDVREGCITGLIGPNGAGKTTVLDACSGLVRIAAGQVRIAGGDVTRLSPAGRGRRGLGRSFQRPALFSSLSVRDNVGLGWEAGRVGASPLRQLVAGPRDGRERDQRVAAALGLAGVGALADRLAASLSTSERRLVELARLLAGQFSTLLLDEPSSGLDEIEKAAFALALRRVVDERGLGLLLVEHDVQLVTELCDAVHMLDFGELVFTGPPELVATSDAVRRAYLGTALV